MVEPTRLAKRVIDLVFDQGELAGLWEHHMGAEMMCRVIQLH